MRKEAIPNFKVDLTKDLFQQTIDLMCQVSKEEKWRPETNNHSATGGSNVLVGYIDNVGFTKYHMYPCHKHIRTFKNAETLWSCFGYRTSKEIAKFYHHWLCYESPWSKLGVVPEQLTEDFMFDTGFVFTNLKQMSCNLLHNFLIATRLVAEWPELITDWYQLVTEHKVDSSLAFVMLTCFLVSKRAPGKVDCTFITEGALSALTYYDKYDWPLDTGRADIDYVMNFVRGNPVGLLKRGYSPTAVTVPVNALWGDVLQAKKIYVKELEDLYSKELAKSEKIRSSINLTDIETSVFTSDAIIEIIKREEVRLGLKEERKVS